ncbi:MAG: filamentous hemagglutinin, partial [Leptolyngbya foveolarum]
WEPTSQTCSDCGFRWGKIALSVRSILCISCGAEQTVISGYAPIAPSVFSTVGTATFVGGSGGNVAVSSQNLSVTEGGYLGASTFGSGQGGNVSITSNAVEVIGATPTSLASNISANTVSGSGNSGNVVLRIGTLNLKDSGLVSTSSIGTGNAGNILLEASERINISGGRPNLPTSTIASTVDFPPLGLQLLLGLSGTPRGSSGDIVIHTPVLNIRDQGTVTVVNLAEGNAGQLIIHANSVVVEQGSINAFTKAGDGGNITLNVRDILLLRAGNINATAKGGGNGGNLRINSPIIIGLENSDIIAKATTGNIDITAQAIFGLTPRAQQTAESDITASSQFGLNGTVSVNGLAVRPEVVLVELSEELSDPDTQVSKSCTASQRNQFIVSGRGGLPPAPRDGLVLTDPWEDLRAIAPTSNHATIDPTKLTPAPPEPTALLEASGWQTDAAGQVILTATAPESRQIDSGNCLTQARLRE